MFFRNHTSVNNNTIINLALLSGLTTFAPAWSVAAEVNTLAQSVAYALAHNRQLAADDQGVEQARAGMDRANGYLMPRVDAQAGVVRTDSPGNYLAMKLNQRQITAADFNPAFLNNPGYINNYQTRVGVVMPVWHGGANWAGRNQAAYQLDASEHGHARMREQITYQAVATYARVRQAEAQIEAVEGAVAAADKRHADTRAMVKRGILIDSDVMDARVHLLRTRVELESAKNALASSRDALAQVMGMDDAESLQAGEEPHLKLAAISLDAAVAEALENRTDLKALEQQQLAAESGISRARASFLPQVDVMAAQEWNSSTLSVKNRNTMIGATVSMNLFAGGSDAAQLRVAQAKVIAMENRLGDLKQRLRNEVALAWRALAEAKLRYESENEAMKQSEESLRIKSLRHKQGLSTTTDLLDAQVQADHARLASISSKYDVVVAKASLLLAMGKLNEEVIR